MKNILSLALLFCLLISCALALSSCDIHVCEHVTDVRIENEITASCLAGGSYDEVTYCTLCSEVIERHTVVTDKSAHIPLPAIRLDGKAPGCEENGSYFNVVYCSICDTELLRSEYELTNLGHNEMIIEGRAPTCTETGFTESVYCSVCNEVLVEKVTLSALGHRGQTSEGRAPTCTEAGFTESVYCSECNEVLVEKVTLPALGHREKTSEGKAPTCTEAGFTESIYCSECNEILSFDEYLPPLGHTEVTVGIVSPTCTEKGYSSSSYCSICNITIKERAEIPPLGHSAKTVAGKKPTCTLTGYSESSYCIICNEELKMKEVIPALGHLKVTVAGKAPTCTESGYTASAYCSLCNETLIAKSRIPELGHTERITAGYPATDTTDGLTESKYCSVCNKILKAATVIPALIQGTDIRSDALTLNGNVLTGMVENNVASFDFAVDIKVNSSASWVLRRTVSGSVLSNKTVSLSDGENTFYITVTYNGTSKVYTVKIIKSKGESTEGSFIPPQYTGEPYVHINGSKPFFAEEEIVKTPFYNYSELDSFGRAGVAFGCICRETMPTDDREDISHIHPSGWYYNGKSNNKSYSISGLNGTVYNRTHLFANMLVSYDVDERNFVTGTSTMNQKHMLSFENLIADYIKETGGHVMYRVTPVFEGDNLICSGLLLEAYSVEDKGDSVEFCVYLFNVQPGIYINYLTGENRLATSDDVIGGTEGNGGSAPETGVAHKLVGVYDSGERYFTGTVSNGLVTTTDITLAADVYFESADSNGSFYIYLYVSGVKKYLVMNGNSTTSIKLSATKDTYWYFNDIGAIVSSYSTGHSLGGRVLATQGQRDDIRAYYEGHIEEGKYTPVKIVNK